MFKGRRYEVNMQVEPIVLFALGIHAISMDVSNGEFLLVRIEICLP